MVAGQNNRPWQRRNMLEAVDLKPVKQFQGDPKTQTQGWLVHVVNVKLLHPMAIRLGLLGAMGVVGWVGVMRHLGLGSL